MLRDQDIREPLFEFLEDKFDKIRIIEEKQIAKSRADVMVVLPDSLVGIEIKSDADTYARLEKQVKDYNRFFDFNYLVVGSTHARHAAENVPDFWGIISAEELEKCRYNYKGKDTYAFVMSDRYIMALYTYCLSARKAVVLENIEMEGLSEAELSMVKLESVREVLFQALLPDDVKFEDGKMYAELSSIYLLC